VLDVSDKNVDVVSSLPVEVRAVTLRLVRICQLGCAALRGGAAALRGGAAE